MKTYLVGAPVRDRLLNDPVQEWTWVVVGATPDELVTAGFKERGTQPPSFFHPESDDIYTLAWCYTDNGIDWGPGVTLEQDLERRDFTINALAEDPDGALIDPCGGRGDLNAGIIRHVSNRFSQEPHWVIRAAGLVARYGQWGFSIAHATHKLMKQLAADPSFAAQLGDENLGQEMLNGVGERQPDRFVRALHQCGALDVLIPELAAVLGKPVAHRKSLDPNSAAARIDDLLRSAGERELLPPLRFAILVAQLAREHNHTELAMTVSQRLGLSDATIERVQQLEVEARHAKDASVMVLLDRLPIDD